MMDWKKVDPSDEHVAWQMAEKKADEWAELMADTTACLMDERMAVQRAA